VASGRVSVLPDGNVAYRVKSSRSARRIGRPMGHPPPGTDSLGFTENP
jgi:hypothetical protein